MVNLPVRGGMRLFAAIDFDGLVKEKIAGFCRELSAAGLRGSFTPPGNLHLTLKFLGDVEPTRLPAIEAALQTVKPVNFTLIPTRCGAFAARGEKTVWLGVEGSGLSDLALAVDQALCNAGFEPERRVFVPHITVARRAVCNDAILAAVALPDFIANVHETTLFESRRDGGRLWYKPLLRANFSNV